ncbi:MAG TPA: protein kinase, partial [Planctomycetota bacterium]|nr:protein kinase [Planctomycetota bacterium]
MPLPSDLLCARIVVQRGFATEERVRECLELQAKNRAVGYDESLHAVLLKRGFLSTEDARKVERDLALAQFVRAERVFARICVERNIIGAEPAKDLLQRQKDEGYRARIGDMLVEQKKLDKAQRDAIAAEQVKRLEAEDEAARQAESPAAKPGIPPPPKPPSAVPSEEGDVTVPAVTGRATDAAVASFKRDQRKFRASATEPALVVQNGVKIEGLEMLARLGQGSVGVVWKARPEAGGAPIGIKVLSPSLTRNPDLLARFQKAFERARAIEHPSLVGLGELTRSGDLWYYTMELVDGETLGERVERAGPLPATKAREMAREVARALAHVHGQRVLHGGLRPSNVLLGKDGSIKVADLILARIAPRLSGEQSTDEARLYASPEELTGAAGADPRDDVYSFGLVLYYALVGRHAFPDAQPSQRLTGPVDPRDADQLADNALSEVVVHATAPSREGRYRDAHELLVAVDPARVSERLVNASPAVLGRTTELPPQGKLDEIGGPVVDSAAARAEKARAKPSGPIPRPPEPPKRDPYGESPMAKVRARVEDSERRKGPGETDEVMPFDLNRSAPPPSVELPPLVQNAAPPRRRRTQAPLPGSRGADLTGQVVNGRYRISSKLGEGGMGVVYRAEHTLMAKTIAFKVLHPSLVKSEESVARFQREVLAMAQFAHRNVVRIYDAGKTEDGRLYMAMELVDGRDLATVEDEVESLTPARAVSILRQILRAVSEGHQKNIVHRDLKPENILLTTGPAGEEVVKVMDFGIAKILEQEDEGPSAPGMFRTMERIVLGTPEYMSPEQASGSAVDHRSDLYSLGVIAYEMFLGRLPFDADSPVGFIGKHIVDPPIPFDEARPGHGLSPAIEAFVMRALEKDPAERFQTADEMARALEEAAPREAASAAAASIEARALAAQKPGSSAKQTRAPSPPQTIADASSGPSGSARPAAASSKRERAPSSPPPEPRPATPPPAAKAAAPAKSNAALLLVVALAAFIFIGAVGAVGAFLFLRVPFEKKLETAKAASDPLVKAGKWAEARIPLEQLLEQAGSDDKPKVQAALDEIAKGEAAAKDAASHQERFDAAVKTAESILGGSDLHLEGQLQAAIGQARDEKVDGAKVQELEKRARKWRVDSHRSLGESLMKVKVASELDAAVEQFRLALQSAEPSERRDLDEKILDVQAMQDEDRANKALEENRFEEALKYAKAALKRKDTPERAELLRKIEERTNEADLDERNKRIAAKLDAARAQENAEKFDEARKTLEEAEKESAKAPEIARQLAEARSRLAQLGKKIEVVNAYKALPPLTDTSPDGRKAAIDGRHAFLEKYKEGPLVSRVKSDLANLEEKIVNEQKMAASAALDKSLAAVLAALEKKDEAGAKAALDEAKKAATVLGTPESAEEVAKTEAELERKVALWRVIEPELVLVPEGKAPEGFKESTLPAFWIGRTEVTNAAYFEFLDATVEKARTDLEAVKAGGDAAAIASAQAVFDAAQARKPQAWGDAGVFPSGQGDFPVAGISFEDARAFCDWKTETVGKAVKIRFRLPREVEWERAARGDDGRKYPWGNDWDDGIAVARGVPLGSAKPAGWEKGQSPFGAVHMAGNVAEWVDSVYVDRNGDVAPDCKVAKGGSYQSARPELLQSTGPASREKLLP